MSSINDDSEDSDNGYSPSGHDGVKSTAVVKYSAVDSPAAFALLQCNTDLNMPPSNWLSSSAESYGLQHVLSNSTGFSRYINIVLNSTFTKRTLVIYAFIQ